MVMSTSYCFSYLIKFTSVIELCIQVLCPIYLVRVHESDCALRIGVVPYFFSQLADGC